MLKPLVMLYSTNLEGVLQLFHFESPSIELQSWMNKKKKYMVASMLIFLLAYCAER